MTAVSDLHQHWPAATTSNKDISLLEYSSEPGGNRGSLDLRGRRAVRNHAEKVPLNSDSARFEIIGWSLLSHVLVAIIVISGAQPDPVGPGTLRRPTSLRLALNGTAIALVIGVVLDHFLASASAEGWAAHLYAALLSV